jgi:uncharacterized protein
VESASIGPVQQEERYVLMDVVRGFALFGVLAANMRSFNLPMQVYETPEKFFAGGVDVWAQSLLNVFISTKFYTLFAFLFGLGFAIQMTRAQARSNLFPKFYLRRLAALAVFGLIHGILIWNGDILFAYSLGGFLLFWFRNAKLKTVRNWIVSLWGFSTAVLTAQWIAQHLGIKLHVGVAIGQGAGPKLADVRSVISVYAHAHLVGTVRETALQYFGGHFPSHAHPFEWMTEYLAPNCVLGAVSVSIFLLGLWVWRKGVLQDLPRFRPSLGRVCAWTLPLGLFLNAAAEIHFHLIGPVPPHARPPFGVLLSDYAGFLGVPILSCGYATLLALLFTSQRRGWVLWLAPVGRMALTNYLTQSIVCVAFYSGMVTGLYGRVGPAWDFVATLALYSAQICFSHWWLARYRFGPMEWLWRTLTYGKPPAMRIA